MKRTLDEGYVLERGNSDLGPIPIAFGVGSDSEFEAVCLLGRSLAVIAIGDDTEARHGLIAIAFNEEAACYIPMEASSLRNMGMGLLRMADELDGGKGKQ